nr:hypothetical protein [Tanacetum cinerariifolium]
PSKTTHLKNEISRFTQRFDETFSEAWECFKDLLRQCPHHDFFELHQLDTFYNALNPNDQDALDSAAGGDFLDKIPRECLSIIESKSKVRYSRSRVTDLRANTNDPPSSSPSNSFDLQQIAASLEDKLDIRMSRFEKSLYDLKASFVTPTSPIKADEEVCVTCGANHSYNHCLLTRGNEFTVFHDNIQQFQTAAVGNFIQGNRHHNISSQFDNLYEFSGPLVPIYIAEEERIRREHADYINRMEMLFTINPRPHPTVNANTKVDTDDVLPPGVENDDSDGEVNDLRVDNSISNYEHESSEREDSDFDNPLVLLPPPEPPDEELNFKDEISVVRNTIVEFECIDAPFLPFL